jgi:hypothetical protein
MNHARAHLANWPAENHPKQDQPVQIAADTLGKRFFVGGK